MDWKRKDLKAQANKAVHGRNYLKTCFISMLVLILSYGTVFSEIIDLMGEMPTAIQDIYTSIFEMDQKINVQLVAVVVTLACGVLLLGSIVKIVLNIFIKNPVEVGARLFMKKTFREDNGMIADLAFAFDRGYANHVKVLLVKDFVILVWTLLLVIPGIVKRYEYRMVPYLLTEDINLKPSEAMKCSQEMMKGHKWKVFLLDLSFIPWHIAGFLSLGILEVFYVQPYVNLTEVALYEVVNSGTNK